MTESNARTSRRAFFLHGGAVLSAGVAASAGAAARVSGAPDGGSARHADREAIRQLQLTFMAGMEDQAYEAVAQLFSDRAPLNLAGLNATGSAGIAHALAQCYRAQQTTTMHSAYRQSGAQRQDAITVHEDGRRATAVFYIEVEISTPLPVDSTAAQMARLQGQMADRRWQSGRFDAQYEKTQDRWRIAALSYS